MDLPRHQIRARYTDTAVTVYQAYAPALGLPAARDGRFPDTWIVSVTDVTPLARRVHAPVRAGDTDAAARLLPAERPYPVAEGDLDHLRPPTTRWGARQRGPVPGTGGAGNGAVAPLVPTRRRARRRGPGAS
ncbi:hypothetical protein [Nocardiopsis sp. FR6]|uniref:hypothetical protein n=1 Tax=unclassified Nocardiopsis TaxID=2649073 RepID=UPI00351A3B27